MAEIRVDADVGRERRGIRGLSATSMVLAVFSLFVVVGMLILFVVHFSLSFFSSDDAVVNMLAESMWQQERLLPRDWINNNGDLMMPSIALIIAPLLSWFPNSFGLHAVGGVFAVLLILGSLIWLLRRLALPWDAILFLTTLMASGFCSSFIAVIYVQTTYVWWPAGFFVGAALIHSHRSLPSNVHSTARWRAPALFALIFCISFANPARIAVMMVLPLYVFDRVFSLGYLREREVGAQRLRWLRALGLDDTFSAIAICASFGLAFALYSILLRVGITHPVYGAAALHWGGWPSVWRHLLTFEGWFTFLGAPPGPLFASLPIIGRLGFLRWIIAFFLTWVVISETMKLRTQSDIARRALASAMVATYFAIAIPYVFFEPLAINGSAMRYFVVPDCIAIALAAFPLRTLLEKWPLAGRSALALAGALSAVLAAPFYVPVTRIGAEDFWTIAESRTMRLARVLQREHLKWGYASWWNAGATTVHTESAVRVWPVQFDNGQLAPFWSMVSTAWYRPEAWPGSSFVAVSNEEYASAGFATVRSILGNPLRVVDSDNFRILIYDYNISAYIGRRADAKPPATDAHNGIVEKQPLIADGCRRFGNKDSLFSWNVLKNADGLREPAVSADPLNVREVGESASGGIFLSCFD